MYYYINLNKKNLIRRIQTIELFTTLTLEFAALTYEFTTQPEPDWSGKLTNACGLGGLFKHHSRLL